MVSGENHSAHRPALDELWIEPRHEAIQRHGDRRIVVRVAVHVLIGGDTPLHVAEHPAEIASLRWNCGDFVFLVKLLVSVVLRIVDVNSTLLLRLAHRAHLDTVMKVEVGPEPKPGRGGCPKLADQRSGRTVLADIEGLVANGRIHYRLDVLDFPA